MTERQLNPPGRTLRPRGRAGDHQEGEGEEFNFGNVSGSDEDDIPRGRSRTQDTETQPVAQDVNSVVPAPVLKPTTADIRYFFDKESADKVFCKECKYVFC